MTEQQASYQISDLVIVSVDTRGFELAARLAKRGWKVVVLELSGGDLSSDMTWADRLGPFLSWENETVEAVDPSGERIRSEFGAIWLPTGMVFLGGRRAETGERHLRLGLGARVFNEAQALSGGGGLDQHWPLALRRSVISNRLLRREKYLDSRAWADLPFEKPVKAMTRADSIAAMRREFAVRAGVRIVDVQRILAVPSRDQHIDRIDVETLAGTSTGPLTERTRSVVWMLSRDESADDSFVAAAAHARGVYELDDVAPELPIESSLAWWRMRFAVKGMGSGYSAYLQRLPEMPPFMVLVGSVERPWSHDNLIVLERAERTGTLTEESQVFDAWIRIPYWARTDHVYRDEQRLLVQERLKARYVGCDFNWVTPSPIALTAPAIRMPFVVYSDTSRFGVRSDQQKKAMRAPIRNLVFAGPETHRATGVWGLRMSEDLWIERLEKMRREWDPAAKQQAPRREEAQP
ncbi:MAG: hypothetical protein IPJ84_17630 [Bdellovibrionales bacterium]|nr:hypothetical protein [Bdellovibrionales bacterium]